jgi:hypothetical protein
MFRRSILPPSSELESNEATYRQSDSRKENLTHVQTIPGAQRTNRSSLFFSLLLPVLSDAPFRPISEPGFPYTGLFLGS